MRKSANRHRISNKLSLRTAAKRRRSTLTNKPKLFVWSSPSGGGKTTLAKRVLKTTPNLVRSVSTTTRAPRRGEQDGRDYFFVTKKEFLKIQKRNGFLENAKVFNQFYGTPKSFIEFHKRMGHDALLLIDVQGAMQVKRRAKKAALIFIMPPSVNELKKRLKKRSTDSAKEIKRRLNIAAKEMKQAKHFDYIVMNSNLKQATKELKSIIVAERLKT